MSHLSVVAPLCAAIVAAACHDATSPAATLTLTRAADLSGRVTQVTYEAANGPAGPYAQYDVWLAVGASTTANAGVVVPTAGPVYVRRGGTTITAVSPRDLHAGDVVELWHDGRAGYGAVQAPPGAPVYMARQVVIDR